MIAPSIALSRGSFMLLIELSPSHSIIMVGHTAWGFGIVTQSLCLPYMMGRSLLFEVVLLLMTWSTPNLCWKLNLVSPVW